MASTVSAFAWDASRGSLEELQTISTLPSGFARVSSTAEIHIDRAGRFLYVSNRGHDSIAIFSIDQATGELTLVGHAATNGQTPRYFTLDPTGNFLFAANQNSSSVVVFRVEPKTGRITPAQTISDIPEPVCMVFVPVSTQVRPAR
jgi:6-phosphogluconolactonase